MKVKVSVDVVPYKEKPQGREVSLIKKRTAGLWQEIELKELANLNGNKGHAVIPAHLDGGIATDDCAAMQLLVLDFDHGCTFAQIKDRCDRMGLKIAYAYHTLSSSPDEEKFRVVFVCEEVIFHNTEEVCACGRNIANALGFRSVNAVMCFQRLDLEQTQGLNFRQTLDCDRRSIIGTCLTEGQKYGLFTILITQFLQGNFSDAVINQFKQGGVRFYFRLTEEEAAMVSRELAGNSRERSALYQKLVQLPQGRCLMVGRHYIKDASCISETYRFVEISDRQET